MSRAASANNHVVYVKLSQLEQHQSDQIDEQSNNMANYGGETGGLTASFDDMGAFGSKSVRLAFIRKVYGILSAQLVITFGFVLIFALQ